MEIPDILDAIHRALVAHGIAATRNAQDVSVPEHHLRFEASIGGLRQIGKFQQLVLTIHIHSQLLSVQPIYECFAGMATTPPKAVVMAFHKFLENTFHPTIEALAGYVCDDMRVDIEHWHRASAAWKVFSGPLFCTAQGEPTLPGSYPGFLHKLRDPGSVHRDRESGSPLYSCLLRRSGICHHRGAAR